MTTGWLIHITFDDHSFGPITDAHVIRCDVFGVLVGETDKAYFVSPWICDGQVRDSNTDCYSIRKHEGLKMRKIKKIRF